MKVAVLSLLLAANASAVEIDLLHPYSLQSQGVAALSFSQMTAFNRLESLYEKAREPNAKIISGLKVGRCFFPDRPQQPVAALLAANVFDDLGPAFKTSAHRRIIPLIATDASADFFDELDNKKAKRILSVIEKHKASVAFAMRTNATVRVDVPRTMELEARSYSLRESSGYVLLRLTCEEPGGCRNRELNRIAFTKGEVGAYCYFFATPKK